MLHLHLQIQFDSDFEGYAAGSIPPAHFPFLYLSLSFWLAAIHGTLCRFFVKSECDYVGGEMTVGMFATPLTLSAAALSGIPWLNFNRCSTMWIRQGALAVLLSCVVRHARIRGWSGCMFTPSGAAELVPAYAWLLSSVCMFLSATCVCERRCATVLNSAACVFSLTQPKGMSCPEKSWKNRVGGPVVNLEHWFYINSRLATDWWPYCADVRGKASILSQKHTLGRTYIQQALLCICNVQKVPFNGLYLTLKKV